MADVLIRRRVWRRVVRNYSGKVPVGGSDSSYGGRTAYCKGRSVKYESSEFSVRLPNASLDELGPASIDKIIRECEDKAGRIPRVGNGDRRLLPDNRYYSLY
jgi:hypothetical protein